jgi:hypothetical protein
MRALLLAVLLAPAAALAEPYAVGDTLPAARFDDQHGRTHLLHERVRAIVFSRDMEAGDVIKAALGNGDGARLLGEAGAVYVADVSGMPGVIRRMFALPKMRQRPYAMLLDTDGDTTARFPSRSGQATVIVLERLRVTNVQYLPDAIGLRAALVGLATDAAAPPP